MKRHLITLSSILIIWSCGSNDNEGSNSSDNAKPIQIEKKADPDDPMSNKGIGPVTSMDLGDLDLRLADEGEKIYNELCLACHKPTEKFIGPPPVGILDRRSPEWVMNMILNPEQMVQEDPIARALLVEYNMAPMANQGLTQDQARAVLEYFRTL